MKRTLIFHRLPVERVKVDWVIKQSEPSIQRKPDPEQLGHVRHVALVELGRVAASLRRMERAGACVPDVERLLADVEAVRLRVRGEWDG